MSSTPGMAPAGPAEKNLLTDPQQSPKKGSASETKEDAPPLSKTLKDTVSDIAAATDQEPASGDGDRREAAAGSTAPTPDVEVRTTRSRVCRNLICKVCRFTCKDSKEFTLHQKTEHAESKDSSQQIHARTRSSSRLNKRAASAACDGKDTTRPSKKTKTGDGLKGQDSRRKQAGGGTKPGIKLTLSIKSTPSIKDPGYVKAVYKLDAAADRQPSVNSTQGLLLLDDSDNTAGEVSPDSVVDKPGHQDQEVPVVVPESSSSPTKTSEEDYSPNSASYPTTEPTTSPDKPDMMISTNGPGLAPHHNDLHNMSGASEDDEDLSEEGGGRLVIDDSSGSGGANSGVLPTRYGNIQNRTYMCEDCDFTTTSAKQSLQHKKDAHGQDFTIYSCNLCDYATRYKQKLPRHYKLHFPGSDTPTEGQIPDSMMSSSSDAETASLSVPPAPTTNHTPTGTSAPPTPTPATPLASSQGGGGLKRSSAEAGLTSPHLHHHPTTNPSVLPAEVILEEGEEEEGEEDELIDTPTTTPPPEDTEIGAGGDGLAPSSAAAGTSSAPPQKKKRKDVSPDKYFEVAEEIANTKYGCATCGNVYKWKKSLNKHWKEKHGNDPGDNQFTPPGMHILLQSQNHIQTEHRRCCHKDFLERITVKKSTTTTADSGDLSSRPDTPQNFLNGHYTNGGLNLSRDDDVDGEEPMSFAAAPAIPVGPFVLGTSSQPVFPTTASGHQRQSLINSLHAPIPSSSAASVLDLTTSSQHSNNNTLDEPDSVEDEAAKPLDFSVQKGGTTTTTPSHSSKLPQSSSSSHPPTSSSALHSQGVTTEEDKEVCALNELVSRDGLLGAGSSKEILKCPRCQEVLKTQTAYSNHMALHLQSANKRVAKCGVCQTHFPNNEALNQHFMEKHFELITSHKEAIQKIPHGLQQTYHLLKMPLQSIPKLSSQETEDPLKCNMCEFTAKWPAELQKHAVSHSDERPFVCMVCGSTYKWKWDLVKHFEKAHSNLPNPYKRRETGASSSSATSAGTETPQGGGGAGGISGVGHDYDMEEGEMSLVRVSKEQAAGGNNTNGAVDSGSFLFEQGSSAPDELSVENLIRTSQQASLMLSRQPNFLDSPENTLASSSASPRPENGGGERLAAFDLSSLQGLPTSSSGIAFVSGDFAMVDDGMGGTPGKHGPVRHMRGRPKEADQPYPSLMARPKNGGKFRGPYKAYKTVEGSESSDLKYQCTLCEYKARWPSEIMQHMKNHSSEKPYGCPNCTYRSKWKWDVVKHLKRCGSGGSIKDVIDYSQKSTARDAPPNVMVTPEGSVVQSQQAASPLPGSEDPALHGLVSDSLPASVLQAPYHPGMPSTPSAAASAAARAYVSMIYQRTKAASEARSSASSSGNSAQNGSEPSPPSSSSSSHQTEPPVTYNSIINEGQHHCLHCTFIASSLAELRRHQAVHSDEKPFTCSECTYSTKWKCDMKKHKEKYKHNSPIIDMKKGDGKEEDKTATKTCPHCSFETQSAEGLQTHMKAEHPASRASPASGKARFPCRQCEFSTNELANLINHRRKHQAQREQEESRQSPSGNGNGAREQDEARKKHPRKRYSCSKCDYVCLTTTELLEHQKQAHGPHPCPFCPLHFDAKGDFLDHLATHPDFLCPEFETFFNVNIYTEEDVNNNTGNPAPAPVVAKKTKVTVVDTGSSANTIDLTAAPIATTPAAADVSDQASVNSLQCQWCHALFANIVRLYQHVSHVHPAQKREQEIAEGLAPTSPANQFQPVRTGKRPSPSFAASSKDGGKKTMMAALPKRSPSPAKLNGRLSGINLAAANMGISLLHAPTIVAQLGQQTQAASSNPGNNAQPLPAPTTTTPAASEMGLNLSTRKADQIPESSMLFQCTKCSFKCHHLDDYQQHIQSHTMAQSMAQLRTLQSMVASSKAFEPNRGMRCWFCSDLFSSYPELYNHMTASHLLRMLERPQQLQDLMAKVGKVVTDAAARRSDSAKVVIPSSTSSLSPGGRDQSTAAGTGTTALAGTIQANWLHHKKVLTYKGYPLQAICGNNDQLWYQCALCPMVDHSPTRISEHTAQVHASSLPEKYQCGTCGHSSKKVQTIIQHHVTSHPNVQPDINVLQYQELSQLEVRQQPARKDSGGFQPSNMSPLSVSVAVDAALGSHHKRSKSSSLVTQTTPVIKKEPVSLTPPQATSSPIDSPMDCEPLDLSTEMPEDQHLGENKEHAAPPLETPSSEEKSARRESAAQQTLTQESVEAQAIMEAEAASDFSKASSGGVDLTNAAAAEEEKNQLPEHKCKHCPFTSRSSFDFRVHTSCHGLKSRYQCDLCSFSHKQLSDLTLHRSVHKHHPRYSHEYTPIVNETAAAGAESTGKASPAPQVTAPAEVLRCPDCPYKTTIVNSFNLHTSMHGQRCQYICDFCDWSADRLVMVLQHRNIHSNEPDFDPSPEDQVFANPEYAKVAPGEFEAKFLDSKFPEEQQTQTSAASPSEVGQTPPFKLSITKKLYTCPHCPYVTGNRTPYDFHLSQHDGVGCYPCEQCSYRTNSWSRMCQHSRLHEEHQKELEQQQQRPGSSDVSKKTSTTTLAPGGSSKSPEQQTASAAAPPSAKETGGEQEVSSDRADAVLPQGGKTSGADAEDDESVEMAEFPDREVEEDNSNSSRASDDGGATNVPAAGASASASASAAPEAAAKSAAEEPELQCERCPFRTPSRLVLSQHGKHHAGGGPVLCPCCDFGCPTKNSLLVHIQLHFPSSLVDMAALQSMLDNRRSSGKSTPESTGGGSNGPQAETAKDSQDSAAGKENSSQGELSPRAPEVGERAEGGKRSGHGQQTTTTTTLTTIPTSTATATATPTPTRVYACRYCDREFENKDIMLQHERQHKG